MLLCPGFASGQGISAGIAADGDGAIRADVPPADGDGERSVTADSVTEAAVMTADSVAMGAADSIAPADSAAVDSTAEKKALLDAEVQYKSNDSIVFFGNGIGYLYGSGEVKYLQAKPIELTGEYIRFNMDSSTVQAWGGVDSVGDPLGDPVFKDGNDQYGSKYMSYNFKTKRGYIKGGVTEQGEGYILADQTKKMEDDMLFLKGGKYTTCNDHEHPHFYLQLTKAKMKPRSYIAAGPAYMVLADVPLPLAVPFGFFPITDSYSSGIIMPTFGDEMQRGFFIKNGGYYFAINDYVDLELLGELYTKGTWALSLSSKYTWRYHFSGNISAYYREDVTGEKGLPNYSKAKNFKLSWQHRQDPKASQYSTFSASVDFATSGYNTSNINNYYNPAEQSKNITSSSVNYTQRFPESPWSISLNANLQQRTQDSTISLTLPSLTVSMSRVYPFKRKNAVGKERFYEKIALSYTMSMSNSITEKENKILHSNFLKDWRNGVKHSIPISASFNLFKYISITPSFNYNERWYFNKVERDWDVARQEEVCDTSYGFYRVYDFSASVSASTKLYGFYTPIRKLFGNKIDRIRHVLTPTVSYSYNPDFGSAPFNFYDTYTRTVIDKNNAEKVTYEDVTYSPYSGGLYGVPGRGTSSSLTFSLKNNVEMKVRDREDTTLFNKRSLIDDLTLSWGYNFAADSMNWNMINASLRIKVTKQFSLNLSGQFDPYMYTINDSGNPVRCNELRWNHGKAPRFLGTGTSFSYTFNNDTFKRKDKKTDEQGDEAEEDVAITDPLDPNASAEAAAADSKKDTETEKDLEGYDKLDIPWSFSINYSVNWRASSRKEDFDYKAMAYKRKFTHNLTFNGSITPTPKWRISFSGSVDLTELKITQTTLSVTRDLHCWGINASISPFGLYKSFMVTIGVNASMLKDLKYEKRSDSSSNIRWLM